MLKGKKEAKLFLFLVLFISPLILQLALAQETPPGLPSELNQNPEELLEQAKNKTETKWDYLGKEWQNIFLKNEYVSSTDAFFTKISVVFVILFGQPYSLSITLLVIIILWLYFFFKFGEIFSTFSFFSKFVSWFISLGLVIILAQFQILRKITEALGWLVFAKKEWWWNLLIIIILIIVFILIYKLSSAGLKKMKKHREELEKEKEKIERKILHSFVEGVEEGFKEKSNLTWLIIIVVLLILALIIAFVSS